MTFSVTKSTDSICYVKLCTSSSPTSRWQQTKREIIEMFICTIIYTRTFFKKRHHKPPVAVYIKFYILDIQSNFLQIPNEQPKDQSGKER